MNPLVVINNKQTHILEFIWTGVSLYFTNLDKLVIPYCIFLLPFIVINASITTTLFEEGIKASLSLDLKLGLMLLISWTLLSVSSVFYTVAIALMVEKVVKGEPVGKLEKPILANFGPLVSLNFWFGLNTACRLLFLVIPGVVYAVNNQFCGLALILRQQQGQSAFQYSRAIVAGHGWKVFRFNSVMGLVGILWLLFHNPLSGLLAFLPKVWSAVLIQGVSGAVTASLSTGYILFFLSLERPQRITERLSG